jgi:hypothetical protein
VVTLLSGAHPALQALEQVGRVMPGVWARYEQVRGAYRAEKEWPAWCYAPIAVAKPFVDGRAKLAAKLTSLAAWRMTKGIYRVDPTLMRALVDTPLDAAVPIDVLRRIPEWCIYIELDQLPTFKGPARGVWVSLEAATQHDPGPVILSLLFDTACDVKTMLDEAAMLPLLVTLSGDSVAKSLEQTYASSAQIQAMLSAVALPVMSILLYLCSINADLTCGGVPGRPVLPAPVKTRRRGEQLYPAAGPIVWELGTRMGAALRAAYAAEERDHGIDDSGRKVVPHLRRAHWHTILSGKRIGVPAAQRDRELRWMPPIAVNLVDVDQLVATVRPVR